MAEIVKRIGPAGYWCRRCAHCNTVKLGCIDDVPIYTCSTYDGVEKEIPGDENITCTMFKLADKGRYPWGSDEDKVLKYCANDVVIIAEQMAREKQKELEDKVDKYEDILVDICDALDPHFDFDKYDDDMEAFENFPSRILDLKRSCKDNFDECIRKMDIINELKAENAKLKDRVDGSYNIRKNELIEHLREKNHHYENIIKDIQDIISPEDNSIWSHSEILYEIKNLKSDSDELKYWKERCHNAESDVTTLNSKVEVLDKRNTNQSVIIGEKGKEIENLAKKNRELQIRVNDLSFQHLEDTKKIVELKDDKYRILKENEYLRNRYPTYSAMKAEDKIEHIQKEAYDILETYFKHDLDGMEFDVSYDDISLTLRYSTPNGDKGNKYNALVSAYERLKKL